MLQAVVVVVVAVTLLGGAKRLVGWWQRERVVRSLDPEVLRRMDRGVSARAIVAGVKRWRGLDARRRTGLRADLLLAGDRFLLATDRGLFLDVHADSEGPLTSIRCTGPGRLVIEGDIGRDDARFRFEITVGDAQGWAAELAPFAGGAPAHFASFGRQV